MKKKLVVLTLICVLLSFLCGCHEIPEFLPGENEDDFQFVWVCKEPFAFFFPVDNYDVYWKNFNDYNERIVKEGEQPIISQANTDKPCWGAMKGYIEKDDDLVCFYSEYNSIDGRTNFREEKDWGVPLPYPAFWGDGDYYKNHFNMEIERDRINLFDGKLPTLRFDKMTKEDFLEQYGHIKNVPELLE